ncbi:MAG: hypothetical protein ACOZIN_16445 [Myxococcota bacterium]
MARKTRRPRGQAMVEYSMLNWILIVGLVLGSTVRMFPGPRTQRNLIELFLASYQTYYDSFFYLLSLPFP